MLTPSLGFALRASRRLSKFAPDKFVLTPSLGFALRASRRLSKFAPG
ncbi:uncharacterized protein sS8_3256 [Methylocaldum marinum]|uniref:Uncharacterized protein n=1 Tax=Methylocaldum marinum TaxID=1432792 RepID=A0A250KZI7_9GAMM|nr:uncharacterized protein sS8_3256 [Methylocaldum marinum]